MGDRKGSETLRNLVGKFRAHLADYSGQFCDGTYTQQRGRSERCALTEIGVRYWDYSDKLFGWRRDADHRPYPMASSYQLVRNILAATVGKDGTLDLDRGHALVIYDRRNPTMVEGGKSEDHWSTAILATKDLGLTRRLSWQEFIAQWPQDETLDWLKEELRAKYGICASN